MCVNLTSNLEDFENTLCRVHEPGVPNGTASLQKLGPADGVATTRVSDRKAWPMWDHSPTPTSFSDQGYAGPLLTALLRPARSRPTGNDRPGTPAR